MTQQSQWGSGQWLALFALGGWLWVLPAPNQAAELEKLDSALQLMPADVSFYSSLLRNKEQIDAVAQSRAWAKLMALPAVQRGWKLVHDELKPDGKLGPVVQFFQVPENRQLLELLGDMLAQECFLCGGAGLPDFVEILQELYGGNMLARPFALAAGVAPGRDIQAVQAAVVLNTLKENLGRLQTPEFVVGFRVTDPRRVEAQLKRLEELASQVPLLKDRLRRSRIGGGDFLSLTLDGSMVPWDAIPFKDLEETPGEFDPVVKKLKELKLVLSLGVRDKYVLFSMGPSNDFLARLGQGQRLLDRPELKPLVPFADRRLTSISYSSKLLRERSSFTGRDVDELVKQITAVLPAGKLSDAQREKIKKHLTALALDLKKYLDKPGACLSFTFLNGRGQEGYSYDWGESPTTDYSKPLTILNHLGGNPVLAVAGRSTGTLDAYKTLSKWLQAAHQHFEEVVLPVLDQEIRDQYNQIATEVVPLARRLDQITATMFLPALADGQSAFVLDARLSSQRWLQVLPISDRPLPMLEPACVLGVSDAALLVKAASAYRQLANDILAKVAMHVPAFPGFEIPAPESRQVKAGTLYYYSLPDDWGLDKQVAPTAGVSDQFAAVTISPSHAQRLLTSTPLKLAAGPLANVKGPTSSAVYFHFPALVDGLAPWLDLAVQAAGTSLAEAVGEQGEKGVASLRQQFGTALEVLKTIRGYTSRTYREDGKTVTHSETIIEDLKP